MSIVDLADLLPDDETDAYYDLLLDLDRVQPWTGGEREPEDIREYADRAYAYNPNQPRAPRGTEIGGRWIGAGGALPSLGGFSRPAGEVSKIPRPNAKNEPVDVGSDVDRALDLLAQGKAVSFYQPRGVSILLDRLAAIVDDAKAKGVDAPNYDLCNVTLRRTSLFCVKNKGISRIKMPQLKGVPVPGSPADNREKDERGEVDLMPAFIERLKSKGATIRSDQAPASHLLATQNELNGPKVAGIARAMESGQMVSDAPTLVTEDNYIIDGHHRWAATVGVNARDDLLENDPPMNLTRVGNMDILDVLREAFEFGTSQGIAAQDAKHKSPERKRESPEDYDRTIAREFPKEYRAKLTDAEEEAIYWHSYGYADPKAIRAAQLKHPGLKEDTYVYRGISKDEPLADYPVDKAGPIPTSLSPGIAGSYKGLGPTTGTVAKIRVPKGTRVTIGEQRNDAGGDSREVLLPSDTRFEWRGDEYVAVPPPEFRGKGFEDAKPPWWSEPSGNAFFKGTKGEEIENWLERHSDVERLPDGRFRFYHAAPRGGARAKAEVLKAGSLLETDPKQAAFFAARDRDLDPEKDIVVWPVDVRPEEIVPGVWAALRSDHAVSGPDELGPLLEPRAGGKRDPAEMTREEFNAQNPSYDWGSSAEIAKRFDALPDDAQVWLYHATDRETAQTMATKGIEPSVKPRSLGRDRFERGEPAEFQPGAGLAPGLTVGPDPRGVEGYGRYIVAVRVRKGDVKASPEQERWGGKGSVTAGQALSVDDAYVGARIPPSDVRLLGDAARGVAVPEQRIPKHPHEEFKKANIRSGAVAASPSRTPRRTLAEVDRYFSSPRFQGFQRTIDDVAAREGLLVHQKPKIGFWKGDMEASAAIEFGPADPAAVKRLARELGIRYDQDVIITFTRGTGPGARYTIRAGSREAAVEAIEALGIEGAAIGQDGVITLYDSDGSIARLAALLAQRLGVQPNIEPGQIDFLEHGKDYEEETEEDGRRTLPRGGGEGGHTAHRATRPSGLRRGLRASPEALARAFEFNPNQPRDGIGRWSRIGGRIAPWKDIVLAKSAFPESEVSMENLTPPEREKVIATWKQHTGVDSGSIAPNIRSVFRSAEGSKSWADGERWYQDAHDWADGRARTHDLEPKTVAGVLSALSPMTEWNTNKHQADLVMQYRSRDPKHFDSLPPQQAAHEAREWAVARGEKWPLGAGRRNIVNAARILQGEPIGSVLQQAKTRGFYNSIAEPNNPIDVVIDTHMLNVAYGGMTEGAAALLLEVPRPGSAEVWGDVVTPEGVDWRARKPFSWFGSPKARGRDVGVIPLLADAIRDVTEEWNREHPDRTLTPMQVQAIAWTRWLELHPAQQKRSAVKAAQRATIEAARKRLIAA
ncbi:MAG: hypothetical protein H0U46_08040 [Actinobacteria bacterium]|nr:hypothetical protein [Actinomycetota bacterium]